MALKTKTGILAICALAAVLAAGLLYYFVLGGGGLKGDAERVASATLGTAVTIGKLSADRATGTYIADTVTIANPPGFKNAAAITIRQVRVVTQTGAPGMVAIAEANFTGAEVFLEVQPQATNLSVLRRNVNRAASVNELAAPKQPWKTTVNRAEMADARLRPVATLQPVETQVVTLPDIVLRGLGEKTQGVLLSEALGQGFEHLVRVASQAAGQAGFFRGMQPEALKVMQEQLGLTQGVLETAVGIVREDVKELTTGIKALLQKGQEQQRLKQQQQEQQQQQQPSVPPAEPAPAPPPAP